MEARYEVRKHALLGECTVAPEIFDEVMPRLERFMEPFVKSFVRTEQVEHAHTFVQGLLSDLEHKNVESIAYRFGQDRLPLQWFVGVSPWDANLLRDELVGQVGQSLGDPEGVLVFDPSAFPKSGQESVGVGRQWCGRLGKVENCQVAVYMGYVSRHEHALVDTRLFLPKEWTKDQARRRKAGVPSEVRFRSRHQLSLEMLQQHGDLLPHRWITGDDEMGRPSWYRRRLKALGERYLLAVPSNTQIRDLQTDPPPYSGRGQRPKRPWTGVDAWAAERDEADWTVVDVRDGAKGPLTVEVTKRRVATRTEKRQEGPEEVLVVLRYKDRDGRLIKTDYYLSNARPDTEEAEFARAAKAEHRIEECLQRAKSETGLADYEVRNWKGWRHHQILSLLAAWFLVTEARRGKKMDPGDHRAADPGRHQCDPSRSVRMRYTLAHHRRTRATTQA
ncbi:MAG: IS701 family transposase [Planctomycetes bacterium]|nr:IS701 family transposase [Planctomycetota bacterium]